MLAQQNIFSLYDTVDNAHRAAGAATPFYAAMAQLLDDRNFIPPFAPWLKDVEPLLKTRRLLAMRYKMLHRFTRAYEKPAFGIEAIEHDGETLAVKETVVREGPFCRLLKFEAADGEAKEKLLLVAPMAGHFATLLRETVRDLLPHFDIYVTDWSNARDVPMSEGGFDLGDYIDMLRKFIRMLGPDLNVMGICQAGAPVMAALSLMEAAGEDALPKSAIVMGAPIDTRQSPTDVNALAATKTTDWFEDRMICTVPSRYPGAHRAVYPGFLQLTAFVMMNPARHQKSLAEGVRAFVDGDFDKEDKVDGFYEEFFSVMDLPAEFYLQTVDAVFKDQKLAKGELVVRGDEAHLDAIRKTPVFAVEAEKDDICGLGQTRAAVDLARNLPAKKKRYFMLEGAGHYGLFNGRRFREILRPEIVDFARKAA